jgi:hypothetical protein
VVVLKVHSASLPPAGSAAGWTAPCCGSSRPRAPAPAPRRVGTDFSPYAPKDTYDYGCFLARLDGHRQVMAGSPAPGASLLQRRGAGDLRAGKVLGYL